MEEIILESNGCGIKVFVDGYPELEDIPKEIRDLIVQSIFESIIQDLE